MLSSIITTIFHGKSRLVDCFVLITCLMIMTSAAIMGDECDWTGSGLTSPPDVRGVTPVYLRCSTGKIKWLYPRGALRVLLRLPGQDRNFRACIRMQTDENRKQSAARVFLEGPRSLIPLYTHSIGENKKAIRCFNSKHGQAAVYIEAMDASFEKKVAEIEYDLQPIPKNENTYDQSEECRPCSMEELAHTFCTSDLVTRGTLHAVENDEDLQQSQMHIKITKLIRHTTGDEYIREMETNEIAEVAFRPQYVIMNRPRHCEVSHGVGEFVFMARKKLGDLALLCAPRLEDWALMVDRLTADGKAHCILKS